MKYDMQFLYSLIAIGLIARKMGFREWIFTGIFVFAFIMLNARDAGKAAFAVFFLAFGFTMVTLYLMKIKEESQESSS